MTDGAALRTALTPTLDALVSRVREMDDWWADEDTSDMYFDAANERYQAAISAAKASALDQILAVLALGERS